MKLLAALVMTQQLHSAHPSAGVHVWSPAGAMVRAAGPAAAAAVRRINFCDGVSVHSRESTAFTGPVLLNDVTFTCPPMTYRLSRPFVSVDINLYCRIALCSLGGAQWYECGSTNSVF